MKTLQIVIIGVVIAVLAFGAGYFSGSIKITELGNMISDLKDNLKDKEVRMMLLQIKDLIRDAAADISMKNFGLAGEKVSTARQTISERINEFDKDVKVKLKGVDASLANIQKRVDSGEAEVKEGMSGLLNRIDRILVKELK